MKLTLTYRADSQIGRGHLVDSQSRLRAALGERVEERKAFSVADQ